MSGTTRRLPMAERVRRAGDEAVPMLMRMHVRAAAQAMAALEALERDEAAGGPDAEEAKRRLFNIFHILILGED